MQQWQYIATNRIYPQKSRASLTLQNQLIQSTYQQIKGEKNVRGSSPGQQKKHLEIGHLWEGVGLALEYKVHTAIRSAPGHAPGYRNVHGSTILSDREVPRTRCVPEDRGRTECGVSVLWRPAQNDGRKGLQLSVCSQTHVSPEPHPFVDLTNTT